MYNQISNDFHIRILTWTIRRCDTCTVHKFATHHSTKSKAFCQHRGMEFVRTFALRCMLRERRTRQGQTCEKKIDQRGDCSEHTTRPHHTQRGPRERELRPKGHSSPFRVTRGLTGLGLGECERGRGKHKMMEGGKKGVCVREEWRENDERSERANERVLCSAARRGTMWRDAGPKDGAGRGRRRQHDPIQGRKARKKRKEGRKKNFSLALDLLLLARVGRRLGGVVSGLVLGLLAEDISLDNELEEAEGDDDDELRAQKVDLRNASRHDVGPASKELVTLALHGQSRGVQEDRETVQELKTNRKKETKKEKR